MYAEFFAQGDLEKQMGLSPKEMMDRQKACVPELQIEFISTVVRPSFEILVNVFPETQVCLDTIEDNRRHWEVKSVIYSELKLIILIGNGFDF